MHSPSRSRRLLPLAALAIVAVGAFLAVAMIGCQSPSQQSAASGVQQGAALVGYLAQPGTPTTQPANLTSTDQTIRTVVQEVGSVVPYGSEVLSGVALAAGAVGAIAGAFAGSSSGSSKWQSVLTEVVTAATGFVDGPWSTATEAAISKAGLTSAANSTPTTTAAAATPAAKAA